MKNMRKMVVEKVFKEEWRKGGDSKLTIDGVTKRVTYSEAFEKIKGYLDEGAVIKHIDYDAACRPHETGRPLELFIDASDYGWCAVLCQRKTPHGAPQIISMFAFAFKNEQLKWSAMERELYAMWQGVVRHDKYIKGVHIFVYVDHKNNLFTASMLDNRRIAKKVSNWALEFQHYDMELSLIHI